MLAEGCRAAEEDTIMNIRWVQRLAEDLPAAAPGPYRLVTFGRSFQWTGEQQAAENVYWDWLGDTEVVMARRPG
jgi:hypothetical protein